MKKIGLLDIYRFHSINVPSEWGRRREQDKQSTQSFHSINVPSEWGPISQIRKKSSDIEVSIQLMSPASGD